MALKLTSCELSRSGHEATTTELNNLLHDARTQIDALRKELEELKSDPWRLPLELLPKGWTLDTICVTHGPPNATITGWRCWIDGPEDSWIYWGGTLREGNGPTPRDAFRAALDAIEVRS